MSNKRKKRKSKLKVVLFLGWFIFLALAGGYYYLFLRQPAQKEEAEDEVVVTKFTYETNANMDINALIVNYLSALTACDQATLQASVTDPSVFDDMSLYQSKAKIITGYSSINCYTVKGYSDDATIVYAISNISIAGVTSTPMDIIRFYVVKKDGKYYIDNSTYSAEVSSYINSVDAMQDMQDLYKMVKDNVDTCLNEDDSFKEFYNKISK